MAMLIRVAILLLAAWVLGFLVFHIAGWLIHILILVAVVLFLVRVIQGKNPLK